MLWCLFLDFIGFYSKSNVYDPTYTNIPDQCREIYQICDIEDENIKNILKEALLNDKEKRICTVILSIIIFTVRNVQ